MDVNFFNNAKASSVKDYVLTDMLFIAVLKNKQKRKVLENKVKKLLTFIKSKKWDHKTIPDKALKHIAKHNLKIHDTQYYNNLIQEWKR